MGVRHAASTAAIFAGIAGNKAALDLSLRPEGSPGRSATDEAGSADLVGRWLPVGPRLRVLEATGGLGWERLVVAALALAGLPVAVAVGNPR
jgi:hypothetical protein